MGYVIILQGRGGGLIFNQAIWDADPAEVAERTAKSFEVYVGPGANSLGQEET